MDEIRDSTFDELNKKIVEELKNSKKIKKELDDSQAIFFEKEKLFKESNERLDKLLKATEAEMKGLEAEMDKKFEQFKRRKIIPSDLEEEVDEGEMEESMSSSDEDSTPSTPTKRKAPGRPPRGWSNRGPGRPLGSKSPRKK